MLGALDRDCDVKSPDCSPPQPYLAQTHQIPCLNKIQSKTGNNLWQCINDWITFNTQRYEHIIVRSVHRRTEVQHKSESSNSTLKVFNTNAQFGLLIFDDKGNGS